MKITPGLEQEDGGIIIQRRVDASVSFEKSWNEYVAGFGDVDGNFWLGLEDIHRLTEEQPMSLQIDVVPFYIPAVSIPYPHFHVGDAVSGYLLNITSGTPGDDNLYNSFNYNSGSKFSTYDRDNDGSGSRSCAAEYLGGWWFYECSKVSLNGLYGCANNIRHIDMWMRYLSDDNFEPIRTVSMKIIILSRFTAEHLLTN